MWYDMGTRQRYILKGSESISIRMVSEKRIALDEFTTAEEATVYATTRDEALTVDTSSFVVGSTLFVVGEAGVYMLDADGNSGGVWRSMTDGTELARGSAVND